MYSYTFYRWQDLRIFWITTKLDVTVIEANPFIIGFHIKLCVLHLSIALRIMCGGGCYVIEQQWMLVQT